MRLFSLFKLAPPPSVRWRDSEIVRCLDGKEGGSGGGRVSGTDLLYRKHILNGPQERITSPVTPNCASRDKVAPKLQSPRRAFRMAYSTLGKTGVEYLETPGFRACAPLSILNLFNDLLIKKYYSILTKKYIYKSLIAPRRWNDTASLHKLLTGLPQSTTWLLGQGKQSESYAFI